MRALLSVSKGAGNGVLEGVRGDPFSQTIPIPKILIKSRLIPKRLKFQGMNISIENPAGSIREGTDQDGHQWRSLLHYDYGYIRGTMGVDKDHVDCFIGPHKSAKQAFVIHQKDTKTGKFDEDKCMLGWRTQAEAKRAYLVNYDRADMFMGMTAMPMDEFKRKVAATKDHPTMIKAKIKAHSRRSKSGKVSQVREHTDSRNEKHGKNVIEITKKAGVITSVTRAIANYRKSPGDLQLAARAAAAYARKENTPMMVVPGNSYMNRVYHIMAATADPKTATVMNRDTKIILAKPTGEVYDAVVLKRGPHE